MKTVKQIGKLTGVSPRTLHHYDAIGLLPPTAQTQAGYRLYDDAALERLYMILIYREIGLSLNQIRQILDAPDYHREQILEQQIRLMKAKVAHLQNCIHFAQGIKLLGVNDMNWKSFDPQLIDEYSAQAKTLYGKTDAYKEYAQKSKHRSSKQEAELGSQVMDFFVRLGGMKHLAADSNAVQEWVAQLQAFFTQHYYTCTPEILANLGEMYADGGSMTENIDAAGGKGTGEFARQAIAIYCRNLTGA